MKRTFILLMSLFAMMAAGAGLRAQEITITLNPGWNWISYPNAATMQVGEALDGFVPMEGDMIKSQYSFTSYYNGRWSGGLTHFMPGWGYMYYSARSEEIEFVFANTEAINVVVTTSEPTDITDESAVVGGTVTIDEGNHVFARGVCWSTEPNPDIDGSHTSNGIGIGSFSDTLTELTSSTTYYVRAYMVTDYGLTYGEEMSFTTNTDYIVFADANVKAICVEHWDTNGDGELSYVEAAAVTTLDNAFYNHQEITTFDELQYFTGLTFLGGDLNNCMNLHSVVLPSTLTRLSGDALGGCHLFSITIPQSVTTIEGGTFNWTSSLEQIIVEEGNPIYDSREDCNAIVETSSNKIIAGCKNTTYPTSVTSIALGAFFGNRSGEVVTIPSHIISIEGNPFVACSVLEQLTVESGNPMYDSRDNCNAIIETSTNALIGGCKNTVIPNTVTRIHGVAFHQVYALTSIVIPSSVITIDNGAFHYTGLSSVTIEFNDPPAWNVSAIFENWNMIVNVPCGSLEAYQNAEGWSEFTNFVEMCDEVPTGAINGKFTINADGDQVYFSQGNLQYIGSASTPYWKFAENQWDVLGTTTGQNSSDQNVDRDLFGWGTSGYNHGANCYQPWSTSQTYSDYYAYGSYTYNLYDQTGQADWGYNPISNGGNQTNQWRTLIQAEWDYVFNSRSTNSGIRYAKAKVNDVKGVILLPDDWSSDTYSLSNTNSSSASYGSNTITASQWSIMEQVGAVFLPNAGYRLGTMVYNNSGGYWSAALYGSSNACIVFFGSSLETNVITSRYEGRSVRLARVVE